MADETHETKTTPQVLGAYYHQLLGAGVTVELAEDIVRDAAHKLHSNEFFGAVRLAGKESLDG
jgi:hypothetical protein